MLALSSNVVDVATSRTLESNTDGLHIVTYNCRSVKSSTDSIKQSRVCVVAQYAVLEANANQREANFRTPPVLEAKSHV